MIDVEQRPLRAFEQNALALPVGLVEQAGSLQGPQGRRRAFLLAAPGAEGSRLTTRQFRRL